MATIIQWNCRGLRANYNDLLLLLSSIEPIACCLQELMVDNNYSFYNRQYNLFTVLPTHPHPNSRPSGGAGILVRKTVPHARIPISSSLQAVACRISTPRPITICSIYLAPNSSWTQSDLLALAAQLPDPILLLGDFNAHSTLWGCPGTDRKGQEVIDFLLSSNMYLFNNQSYTYVHPATGTRSSIDLSFCDPSLAMDFSWEVHDDLCCSDHCPIVLKTDSSTQLDRVQRFRLDKADWPSFTNRCAFELSYNKVKTACDPMDFFSNTLIAIANATIPKTSKNSNMPRKPWFNDECKVAIKNRKLALRQLTASPSAANIDNYRVLRAKARRTIRSSKRDSWKAYISKLTSNTPLKQIWSMVRRISGKHSTAPVSHLKVNGTTVEEPRDIANTIGKTFSYNSSTRHYTDKFRRYQLAQEKLPLNFSSNNQECYNQVFSMQELKDALRKSNNSATGPDEIHYQMLKHLPESTLETLLHLFNDIWISGCFPPSWSEAIVIPIPKPGKDPTSPDNYRPIALTSCMCKTFERMVNDRLVWFLESNNLLSEYQSGFRKQRCTTDQLVRFESFIREPFVRREHVVSVFFDLEKAYDTTWKYGIMRDLNRIGLKGRLTESISAFLSNRLFRVRVGTYLSDSFPQEMGVPQGSILSVTLFILKINSIISCLSPSIKCSLYVDDFLICCRSRYMPSIERLMQLCLNNIQTWADENGFKFSKTKTVCMHFCQQRALHPHPDLLLNGVKIPVVEETKFLGLIFDSKLSFQSHLKYLKDRCVKALNLLRVIGHTDWGADTETLLRLYRSHVRSKLDYGCVVYGSARNSYLKCLDSIQNAAIRTCLGAFRTSPISSLHVEANELPIDLRRPKLCLQYMNKLSSNHGNPAYPCVFTKKYKTLFDAKPTVIPTLGLRLEQHLKESGINVGCVAQYSVCTVPPWLLCTATFIYDLHRLGSKNDISPDVFRCKLNELLSAFDCYERIYTDGSKDGPRVAAAAIWRRGPLVRRLPDGASIFSGEACAVLLALDVVERYDLDKVLILTDSLSCLQGIENRHFTNPLILDIIVRIHHLISGGCEIKFIWLPSHMGVPGNTAVDGAAKAALNLPASATPVPWSDFKPIVNSFIVSKWQQSWDQEVNNKLHRIVSRISVKEKIISGGALFVIDSFRGNGDRASNPHRVVSDTSVDSVLVYCGNDE